jgi:S1-C subfamily serine protease
MLCPRSLFASALLLLALPSLRAQGAVAATLLRPRAEEASDPARRAGSAGLVAKVRPAVVHVVLEVDGPSGAFRIERASSGVIVAKEGLVATFSHLVAEAAGAADKRLFVQLDDAANSRLPASVAHADAARGLTLLKITPPDAGLTAAVLRSERALPGTPVVVLARPEGKEMFAFAGVASMALGGVSLRGQPFAAADLLLCDARNDERCDGAPVFDDGGRLVGLYAAEHVQRDVSEPTLQDLLRPSFGVIVPADVVRRAFQQPLANAAAGQAPVAEFANAVDRAAPSIAAVWSGDGDWPQPGADDPGGVVRRAGIGSGVVLSKAGLVVANAHVAEEGKPQVRVGGRTFAATVVKSHRATNLALLQLELPAGVSLTPIAVNAADDAIVGEVVLALGNPYGTGIAVSAGVVSARRDREGGRVQADANLGNQNGGGAVIDRHGRLLGIVDAGALDPIAQQFAQRGERMTTETNLSTFVGVGRLRKVFATELGAEGLPAAAVSEAERAARRGSLATMVEQKAAALLNIYVQRSITKVDEDDPFASMKEPEFAPISLGSGVIIDPSGLALSNWHVVDDATRPDGSAVADHRVTARTFGGKEYRVQVLSISREDDLALLQLELPAGEQVPAVELGSSDALALGETVAAIGNPHGRANTVTAGVVSAKEQELRVRGRWAKLAQLVETDAAINGGNSGGALLDANGRLVGINSAGGGTFNNKGYAIAVDHVRKQLLSLLLTSWKLRSADLGCRVMDDERGVSVLDCDGRGPAARAGLQSGDRILALGDVAITWSPGFALQLRNVPAGQEVALKIERKGTVQTLRATPLPAAVWGIVRQSGLEVRELPYAEDGERVRQAAIGLHRAFTGDRSGEPTTIPERAILIQTVHPGEQPVDSDVRAGDLILAVELRNASGNPVLQPLTEITALRDLWNDRELGSYDGQRWKCWVARGAEVRAVTITAKRLFW